MKSKPATKRPSGPTRRVASPNDVSRSVALSPLPDVPPLVRRAAFAVAIGGAAVGCGDDDGGPVPTTPMVDMGIVAPMPPMPPMPAPIDAATPMPPPDMSVTPMVDMGVVPPMPPPVDMGLTPMIDMGPIPPMPPPMPPPPMTPMVDMGPPEEDDAGPDATVVAPMPPPMPPPMPAPKSGKRGRGR